MKYFALLLLALLTLTNFKSRKDLFANLDINTKAPAGTVRVEDNFFADQTEVSNQYWLDYLHHVGVQYGKESEEYKSTLPDTSVWSKKYGACADGMPEFYLRHPAYRDYPIVGVTQQQADNYCKWRSDRVFEYLLIHSGIIAEDSKAIFTIEKFYKGEVKLLSNKMPEYFPTYNLPTSQQWNNIRAYNAAFQSQLKPNKKGVIQKNGLTASTVYCSDSTFIPIACIYESAYKPPKKYLYNLDENVREWLKEENIAAGSSWIDSDISVPLVIESADASTGFRCVAQWKKWGE